MNIRIRQHKYNLREGHIDKSKLESYAFEEGHRIGVTRPYYNLNLTPYTGNIKRQHICFVLTPPSVSLVWTYVLFGFH